MHSFAPDFVAGCGGLQASLVPSGLSRFGFARNARKSQVCPVFPRHVSEVATSWQKVSKLVNAERKQKTLRDFESKRLRMPGREGWHGGESLEERLEAAGLALEEKEFLILQAGAFGEGV